MAATQPEARMSVKSGDSARSLAPRGAGVYLRAMDEPVNITAPRLFTASALGEGFSVEATPGQAHYLGHVMRRAAGGVVRLFNGRDGEWEVVIASIRRDRAVFEARRRLRPQGPAPDLWLAFAPLKRDATDLLVQKATELGASALLPVFTERTNAARVNLDRLSAIAMEAAEQCELLCVPEVRAPVGFAEFLASWPGERPLAAALERGAPCPVPEARGLIVGPEGGFAASESASLLAAPFARPIWLGPTVLRAETAALAGLVLLQAPGWAI